MEPLEIKVSVTKDDLLELGHDTHENVTMWFGFIAGLYFLSFVPGNAGIILMGLAALFFARLEIARHRYTDKFGNDIAMWLFRIRN